MTEQERKQAIRDISVAFQNVLKVDPQLLFRASQDLFSEMMIENIAHVVDSSKSNRTKRKQNERNMAILQSVGQILLKCGAAHLDPEDYVALNQYIETFKK